MTITTTWSVNQMTHEDSDGGVILVYWSLIAKNVVTPASGDTPAVYGPESASEGGKLRLDPDPTSPDYIPYADLTENDVLGWVYNSLIEGDETADEAKARVEANRTAKVQGQIDRAATQSDGLPWDA
jgi:hypothetical protein